MVRGETLPSQVGVDGFSCQDLSCVPALALSSKVVLFVPVWGRIPFSQTFAPGMLASSPSDLQVFRGRSQMTSSKILDPPPPSSHQNYKISKQIT